MKSFRRNDIPVHTSDCWLFLNVFLRWGSYPPTHPAIKCQFRLRHSTKEQSRPTNDSDLAHTITHSDILL